MDVRWSALAADDLERICERIAHDNPEVASRAAQTIYAGCACLNDMPYIGRLSLRMSGRRELVFARLPYIAVYRVVGDSVEISRIYHGAQDWP